VLVHVPCHLQHFWHGPMRRRRYMERWEILKKHRFDPSIHLRQHSSGLYLWSTSHCPPGLIHEVAEYFDQRLEDSDDVSEDIVKPRKTNDPSLDVIHNNWSVVDSNITGGSDNCTDADHDATCRNHPTHHHDNAAMAAGAVAEFASAAEFASTSTPSDPFNFYA
jgi:hypothetical protein